jgi:alginate production protein
MEKDNILNNYTVSSMKTNRGIFTVRIITLLVAPDLHAITLRLAKQSYNLFDIDTPPAGKHQLSQTLSYKTDLTLERTIESNYDLDNNSKSDLDLLSTELEFELAYIPSKQWDALINLEIVEETELEDESDNFSHATELNIKELNLSFRDFQPNMVLKIGRQAYKDEREWLYDEELDAIRLLYYTNNLAIKASISSDQIFKKDILHNNDNIDIYNYILLADYRTNKQYNIAAYLFIRDDHEIKRRLTWLGLRSRIKNPHGFEFWFESAYVTGKSNLSSDGLQQRIDAFALDLGTLFVIDAALKPTVTLGWAYGSADNNAKNYEDNNFYQTGLQDNNGRFNGITSFKYYGEVFEPELSNLYITTIGFGIRPLEETSIDLVYHTYLEANKKMS